MAAEKLIPLAQQPEYQTAMRKVSDIGVALAKTNDLLNTYTTQLREIQSRPKREVSALDRALAIAGGATLEEAPVIRSVTEEINRLTQQKKTLQDGYNQAVAEAEQVANRLALEAGAKAKARHVATVAHVVDCLEQLCAANEAEEQVRRELERLGYDRHGLSPRKFMTIGSINDTTGSPAYYFAKDAKQYIA